MPKLKTDHLQPGMVVASDIKNMEDMLLVPAGCMLSERHIRILKTWGITEVHVKATSEEDKSASFLEQPPIKLPPELLAEIKARFWSLDESNPVQAEIFRLMLGRRAKSLSSK